MAAQGEAWARGRHWTWMPLRPLFFGARRGRTRVLTRPWWTAKRTPQLVTSNSSSSPPPPPAVSLLFIALCPCVFHSPSFSLPPLPAASLPPIPSLIHLCTVCVLLTAPSPIAAASAPPPQFPCALSALVLHKSNHSHDGQHAKSTDG